MFRNRIDFDLYFNFKEKDTKIWSKEWIKIWAISFTSGLQLQSIDVYIQIKIKKLEFRIKLPKFNEFKLNGL